MDQSERYKQSLLKSIQREWLALLDVVDRLTPEQMLTPDEGGWAPKDNLAHLTQWLKILLGYHFDGRSSADLLGLPPELAADFDFNRVNAWMFEQNRNRPAGEVLAELKAKYAETVTRLESLPLAELIKPHFDDDEEKRPLVLWVLGNTSEHFAEHREIIARQLK